VKETTKESTMLEIILFGLAVVAVCLVVDSFVTA
jgi:hypothetical protein